MTNLEIDILQTKQFRSAIVVEMNEGEDEYTLDEAINGMMYEDIDELVSVLKQKGFKAEIVNQFGDVFHEEIEILSIDEC